MRIRDRLLRKKWSNITPNEILALAKEECRLDVDPRKIASVLREMPSDAKVSTSHLNFFLLLTQRAVTLHDPNEKLTEITINLSKDVYTRIRNLAQASGKTVNEIVEICITWHLSRIERAKKKSGRKTKK